MKVWECTACGLHCLCTTDDELPLGCCVTDDVEVPADWHETTRFEITERKPDWAGMAEKEQLGKDESGRICILLGYHESWENPFTVWALPDSGKSSSKSFTPCSKPEELDPITMEPKNDR